jgi:regulator of RNase E activity RraA
MSAHGTVQRLNRLDTSAVSDAMDSLGLKGVVLGIHPVSVVRRIAGNVVTVELRAGPRLGASAHLGARAIDGAEPGCVIVVAHEKRLEVAGWGGLLCAAARKRGIAGVIVDGACRDLDEAVELDFPVFARASVPVTARGRVYEACFNQPVSIGGLKISQYDLVIADRSGVVVLPKERAEEIIDLAEKIVTAEHELRARIIAGEPAESVLGTQYESLIRGKEAK